MKIVDFILGRIGCALIGSIIGLIYGIVLFPLLKIFLLNTGFTSIILVCSSVFATMGLIKGENIADTAVNALYFVMGALLALFVADGTSTVTNKDNLVVQDKEKTGFMFWGLGLIAVFLIFMLDSR